MDNIRVLKITFALYVVLIVLGFFSSNMKYMALVGLIGALYTVHLINGVKNG